MRAILVFLLLTATACGTSRGQVFQPTAQDTIVVPDAQPELLFAAGDFTEGPALAPDGAILFSDIGNRILRFDPGSGAVTVFRSPSGKANGLMFDAQGRLLACEGANGGNRRLSITAADGSVRTLADRFDGKRFNSPNDLALDPQGHVYFTDPRYGGNEPRELDFEGVFRVSPRGDVQLATRDLEKPNGILVAADGKTVFVADNNSDPRGNHQLLAFDVQDDGRLANKRVLFDFGPNRRGIDGMTLDRQGNIYATAGRGDESGIYVFDPRGVQLAFLATADSPTNCVFGGGDRAQVLFITASAPAAASGQRRYGLYMLKLKTGR